MMIQTPADYDAALRRAVDRIAAQFDPDKIILFGSRARNQGRPDSDTDLLVVTPDHLARHRDTTATILHEAVHEGKVLYGRAGATSTI